MTTLTVISIALACFALGTFAGAWAAIWQVQGALDRGELIRLRKGRF